MSQKFWNFLLFEHIITFQGLHQLRAEPILLEGWVRAFCHPRKNDTPTHASFPIYSNPRDPYNLAMNISRILNRPWHRNPRNLKFSKINFRARFIIFNIANACCWLAGRVPNLALHKVWIWRHLTLHQPTTWSILIGLLSSTVTWFWGHLRSIILFVKIVVVIFGMEYGALCCSFGPSSLGQPTLFLLTTATTCGCNFDQWKKGD